MSANIDAVLARLDEMNNGEINYEVYRELHDLVSAIEDDVQAPIELFPGTLEALDALSIRARATSPDAATEARRPEGWSTEDRREAKCEAERRWSRPVMREAEQRYQAGNINGFILGAEWQKARETFISYKVIADEARAERDAALAALERVRAVCLHLGGVDGDVSQPAPSYYTSIGRNVVATEVLAALDGAPEHEWEYQCTNNINTTELLADPELHAKRCSGKIERRRKAGPWGPVEGEKP